MAIVREVTIGGCRLIQGDMRTVLPLLDARANMVLSDPPYKITSGGNTSGEMRGCFAPGRYDNNGDLFPIVAWADMAPLIFAALAENADVIIMASDREEMDARAAFLGAGFAFHRLLVWGKITATPNRWYMPNCEFGLYLYKGRARVLNDCSKKALVRCPQSDVSQLYHGAAVPVDQRFAHATEKPVSLMEYWLGNSTAPGDMVLDPFMGSGSTIVAAARLGRRAIGIEQDSRWFDVACARVAEASQSPGFDFSDLPAQAALAGARAV